MEEIKKKQAISLAEVKEILGKVDVEEMDQIQRWTYDYVSKFTTTDAKEAKEMKKQLVKECELTEDEAVEIVNIRPTSLAELRSFTFGWKKLILAETLEKMLKIIKEHS
ncbi:MAG: RNA polymerase Rpb4 [Nitrosopumilus sp.]|jgi:DNA-directed RNA polymerase subunit F|nr:MAG: RNA polymerase Rpb4 [Nitrosopumilus sp.]